MLIEKGRENSTFIDPSNPTQNIEWQGRWRTWTGCGSSVRTGAISPKPGSTNFGRLLFNTLAIAIIGTIGAVGSAVIVAYGFARFRFPGKTFCSRSWSGRSSCRSR